MLVKLKFQPADPKHDFIAMEKRLLDYWYSEGIVKKYLTKNKNSKKKFSFLDGPITANGPMGVHHAWGRTYKDLWQRFYNMRGFKQRFQNGFDEQGLWVEVGVERELGIKSKKEIEHLVNGDIFASVAKFVDLCKERVKKYSTVQTEQSKRLGYFMDWGNSYHTSSDENNYAIWNFLKVCHQKGYLYEGRDSVPWCPRCGTAVSQHEILTEEYKEITRKAVYIKYQIAKSKKQKEFLLVWTTTPWTLPSNVAIAVNPELDYSQVLVENELFWLASSLKSKLLPRAKEVKRVKGRTLLGIEYFGIFEGFKAVAGVKHKVVGSVDLVTAEEGTGLVHIAPGAGEEDFDLAQKESLPVIASIDESANYIGGFGQLTGKNAKKDPALVIDKLVESGVLFKTEDYTHRYPVCWRCKTELVWRVVDEWYIAMDRIPQDAPRGKLNTLREQMIEVAKKVRWIPEFGLERELDWLKNMQDWLISKKRYWGLALPIWECSSCGYFDVIGSRDELKEKAVAGWEKFAGHTPHRPWIDEVKLRCFQCQSVVARISDVGSPWLDAGIVPFSTMPKDWFPAEFITESFPGQFKNWFYSLIAMSTVLAQTNPFKTVLGFATLLDEKGEEMHKSKGNAIEFNEAADKIGVDIIRWMYLSQNPVNNLLFGYHKADDIRRRFYLIFWNVYVFFVTYANLDHWQPKPILNLKLVANANFASQKKILNVLDRWILSRFAGLVGTVTGSLSNYNAHLSCAAIEDFVVADLSTWYLRRSRERVGPTVTESDGKDSFYTTLYIILLNLCKLVAPFIPFIAEEIFINLTGYKSVHLSNYPRPGTFKINKQLEEQMEKAREVVTAAHAVRKSNRIKVRQPLTSLTYGSEKRLDFEIEQIIAKEINVKKVVCKPDQKELVVLDIRITSLLKEEGEVRELVRKIQELRKQAGCNLDQKITIVAPKWPKKFEKFILRQTLAEKIENGKLLKIKV